MNDKRKYSTSQLFNFAKDSYFERTSRPIYAVIFLLPFIVFYEFGTIVINTDVLNQTQVRVVAFVWLQRSLEYIGLGGKLAWAAPPLVVVIILIALQMTCRKSWRVWVNDMLPMGMECILLAIPLIVLSLFLITNSSAQGRSEVGQFSNSEVVVQADTGLNTLSVTNDVGSAELESSGQRDGLLANIVTSIGAGIYEELVFRLILICLLMIVFQNLMRMGRKNAIVVSVLVSAALFSAHHHIDFFSGQLNQGEPFEVTRFVFRAIAGIYFAVLFAIRGFGITAGTHAFYDIIAVLVRVVFFPQ